MSTQHRATTGQWLVLERQAETLGCASSRALLELRARVEALEAGATCPHVRSSDEGTSYCALAESVAAPTVKESLTVDGSLDQMIINAMLAAHIKGSGTSFPVPHTDEIEAAIRAVAAWVEQQAPEVGPIGKLLEQSGHQLSTPFEVIADMLRREADR